MNIPLIDPDAGLVFKSQNCTRIRTAAVQRGNRLSGVCIPCRLRYCPGCGGVRLNRATAAILATASLGECIYAGYIDDADREAVSKRIKRRGYVCRLFPRDDGTTACFSTDPREGQVVTPDELPFALQFAWNATASAGRKCGGTRAWTIPFDEPVPPHDRVFLGLTGVPFSRHKEILERILGDGVAVVVDDRWSVDVKDPDQKRELTRTLRLMSPEELARRRRFSLALRDYELDTPTDTPPVGPADLIR